MDLRLGKIDKGQARLGYTVAFVSTTDSTKPIPEYQMVNNIVSQKQVDEVAGANSRASKMYKQWHTIDVNSEIDLSLILVPSVDAKPTVHTVTIGGNANDNGTATLKVGTQEFTSDYTADTTASDLATALATEANNDATLGFNAEANAEKLTLTAKSVDKDLDNVKVELTFSTVGLLAETSTTGATVTDLSGLPSFLDKKNKKFNLYLVGKNLDPKDLIEKLEEYQTMDDRDMMGAIGIMDYGTYGDLIERSQEYNKNYVYYGGYKEGAFELDKDELAASIFAVPSLCYTPGSDCSKYIPDSPIGSISNMSLPIAGAVISHLSIKDGYEWENAEKKNLGKNGVFTGYNNSTGALTLYRMTTTKYLASDGKETSIYKYAQADLELSQFMSYCFQRLDIAFQHKRLEKKTISDVLTEFKRCYSVCSGSANDPDTGDTYILLDGDSTSESKFTESLKKSISTNFLDGSISFAEIQTTVMAQLRSITAFFLPKFYVEA